jgi:hypothetical protein
MPSFDLNRLREIQTLPSLVKYMRDELGWPIDQDAVEDDLTFEYQPEELGILPESAVAIKEIKQIRPLDYRQPWGVFWVNFEKKRLPVVMLRRILGHLVVKKRTPADRAKQRSWHLHDLLFISSYGEAADRAITFAHFSHDPETRRDLSVLRVLGWDGADTVLHLADAHETLAAKLRWPADPDDLPRWREQWGSAFTVGYRQVIETTEELVTELAKLALSIRRRTVVLLSKETERGPLRRLYGAFQTALIHDLIEDDFADVMAQTLTYGLLIAKFSRPTGISADNLVDIIPATNPFLRDLLMTFLETAGRKGHFDFDELGIQDVVEMLNRADTEAVKRDFGNKTRREDPVIHFYEHFLNVYDKAKKVRRGVFYTPQPVVSYIVRSLHELLQSEFKLEDGLASTVTWGEFTTKYAKEMMIPEGARPDEFFVNILDPATGTATFLVEVMEIVFGHLCEKWKKAGAAAMPQIPGKAGPLASFKEYWNAYVPACLLPRLYGYELMMAPYIIAHMKLGLKLAEINTRLGQPGYQFMFEGRAHIYLTNSLQAADNRQLKLAGFDALAHEAAAVNDIKRHKRFTVVIGNPPYSLVSANMEPAHRTLVERYKMVGAERIHERGALQLEKILNDDYVKFWAFSQNLLDQTGRGLLGLITNHAYLDNPTMRGLRHSLLSDFYRAMFLDLRGSAKKAGGDVDENVFDIQQGVAIGIMVKGESNQHQDYLHASLRGTRTAKYAELERFSCGSITWSMLEPVKPFFLFVPTDYGLRAEYDRFTELNRIFPLKSIGLFTSKDSLVLDWDSESVEKKVRMFQLSRLSNEDLCLHVGITAKKAWDVTRSRDRLRALKDLKRYIVRFRNRPFDHKYLFYEKSLVWSMAWPVNRNLLAGGNLALTVSRQLAAPPWNHIFCSDTIVELCYITNKTKEGNHVFPLYIVPADNGDQRFLLKCGSREPNLNPAFLARFSAILSLDMAGKARPLEDLTPENVFYYIYGVMHSSTYRQRYLEFLKIDFPRVPLTGSIELFRGLAELGGELVALHLMDSPKLVKNITKWVGGWSPEVDKVSYADKTVWIDRAQTEGFRNVPETVWNFYIGGYQVCEKWLKDRKGRRLSADNIAHYQKIVVAIAETIRLMKEIDEVIKAHGGWPGAFQGDKDEIEKDKSSKVRT